MYEFSLESTDADTHRRGVRCVTPLVHAASYFFSQIWANSGGNRPPPCRGPPFFSSCGLVREGEKKKKREREKEEEIRTTLLYVHLLVKVALIGNEGRHWKFMEATN